MALWQQIEKGCAKTLWKLTPACDKAVVLASRRMEEPLPFWTKLGLEIHYKLCCVCLHYQNQLEAIHKAAPTYAEKMEALPIAEMSPECRERLRKAVGEAGERKK